MNVKIEVTQDDIDSGITANCRSCPVALAINRVLKSDFYCRVDVGCFSIYNHNQVISILEAANHKQELEMGLLPVPIQWWIQHYDTTLTVLPVSFVAKISKHFLKEAA